MTETATPSAAPLTMNTSSRRRKSLFFSGAKNGISVLTVVLRSMFRVGRASHGIRPVNQSRKYRTWISGVSRTTGGCTEGGDQSRVGRENSTAMGMKISPM